MTTTYTAEVQNASSVYEEVPNLVSVKYTEPGIVLTDIPTFEIETDNATGRRTNKYSVGKLCRIKRDGVIVFIGIIEPRTFDKQASSGSTMKFGGSHCGYAYLRDRVCDYYRADNNSYASVVNPWQFGRLTDGTTNALIDGLRPDEIMQCLIGTKFIWQEWFDDHSFLRWTTTQPELVVYNGALKLPKTNATTATADTYATAGYVESVGLYNGDKYVDVMGTIQSVSVKLLGTKYSTYDPILYVCRDADATPPSWHAVSLTYDGAGVWTGNYTFVDAPVNRNQFGYYTSLNSDGNGTTAIDYARFDCVTTSDTSVTAGTVATYNDPNTSDDSVAINLAGLNRLEALEKVRLLTNTSTIYADVNWDAYIDNDNLFHFAEVRGTDIDKTFSFDNRNTKLIKQSYDGLIKNALIALGQGEEPYAVTLTGSDLQDAASIVLYGKKTGYFVDKSIPDAPTLYKRSKAYLKYMASPRENLQIEICNDPGLVWNVGDRVHVEDTELDIDDNYRVLTRTITKTNDQAEQIDIELGTKSNTVGGLLRNIQNRFTNQEVITQGSASPINTLAAGLVFDCTTAAEYQFYVPANAQQVLLSVKTAKFRAYSKADSGLESAHTHPITGATTGYTAPSISGSSGSTGAAVSGTSSGDSDQGVVVSATSYSMLWAPDSAVWETVFSHYVGANHTGSYVIHLNIYGFESAGTDRVYACYVRLWDGTSYYPFSDGSGVSFGAPSKVPSASDSVGSYNITFPTFRDFYGKTVYVQICLYSWSGLNISPVYTDCTGLAIAQHTHGANTYAAASHTHTALNYAIQNHAHTLGGVATGAGSEHSHSIAFGIYEYGYYPAKVCMRIDSLSNPIINKFGLIGTTATPATVTDLDITHELRDTSGKLIEGIHTLYFNSQSVSPNTDGLGIIAVSHKVIVNTSDADLSPMPVVL